MIWSERRIGWPTGIGRIATLWPAGMRSTVVTPSATTVPDGMLERAIRTPSSGCSRMTGAGAMCVSLCLTNGPYPEEQAQPGSRRMAAVLNALVLRDGLSGLLSMRALYTDQLRLAVRILAGLRNLHLGVGRHQSAFVRQRHELEAHVDRFRRTNRATAVNARKNTALAAFLYELFVDLHDLGLFTVELRHKTVGEAEVGRTDIDAGDTVDIENGFHVLDRGLGLHHRDAQCLGVRSLLIGACRTVHARSDRAVAAGAARRIFAIGDEVFGFFLGVDHRADHAIGAAVQHLADDAGFVPGAADHRLHWMGVHRLKALHHRQVILHAVLHVDGDAVEPALRDLLGRKTRWNRESGVHHGLARSPDFLDVIC